jgi:hypothetical protein
MLLSMQTNLKKHALRLIVSILYTNKVHDVYTRRRQPMGYMLNQLYIGNQLRHVRLHVLTGVVHRKCVVMYNEIWSVQQMQ